MFGKQKSLICNGGEWTTVIDTRFAQLPMSWSIRVQADAADALGEYEETKSAWVFAGKPTLAALQAEMSFHRGYWNPFYKVRVRPLRNITISVERAFF